MTVKRENQNLACFSEEAMNMKLEGNVQSKKISKDTNSYLSV